MKRRSPHPRIATGGSVLIAVLFVCLGLVSVTLLFGHSMLLNYRGVDNELAGHQADQAIDGAARYAETLLLNQTTPGLFPDPTSYQSDAIPIGEATFWFIGRPTDTSTTATRQFGLTDEAAKLNLNTATVEMLQALPGMTVELAAAIIDWRDTDDDVSENGAESETYANLQPGYKCKNGPFESIEELALLNGATREILYGEDANLNGVLDVSEDDSDKSPPADNSDGKLDPGILEYVTCYSREPNKRADGTTARVNVTQPGDDLTTLLTDTLGQSRADEISAIVAVPPPVRSVLEFYTRSGMTADEFKQVEPSLTVSADEYLTGLVNVNTAPEAVLACIPGIGIDNAASLVSARLQRSTTDTSIAWVVDTLGAENAALAGPFLTGQSWQIGADIAAVGRNGHGYRREKIVIDQSTRTPRIVYRRNLAPLGWALGSDIRESLALKKEVR